MIKQKKIGMNLLIINLLAFFSILSPNIYLRGLPYIRLEHIVTVVAIFYLISKGVLKEKFEMKILVFPILLVIFGFINLLSMVNGDINGYNLIVNDIFEIYKVVLYAGIFLVAVSLIREEKEKIGVLKSMNIFIFITNIISFTQYFNLFNLNMKYIKYIAPSQQRALMPGYRWPRVVGISDNPNVYSYIVVIGLVISVALFLYTKNKFYILSTGTNFLTLLMTRSRTGFVMFGVALGVFILLYLIQDILKGQISIKDKGKWVFAIIGGVVVFLIVFIFVLPENLTWRVKEIFNLSSTNSWQARLRNWNEYLQYFIRHPYLGVGPAKAIDYARHPDNEWLLLLKRYGLVGTFYYMLMFLTPIGLSWNRLKSSLVGKVFISIIIGSFVYMIPAIAFHSFQLMSVTMILAAIALSSPKKIIKNIE